MSAEGNVRRPVSFETAQSVLSAGGGTVTGLGPLGPNNLQSSFAMYSATATSMSGSLTSVPVVQLSAAAGSPKQTSSGRLMRMLLL
jgi:hypothetical protein